MSSDNTLDDLILTEPEPEKAKSKGLLALLALVILLIIVGAILAKMIFSEPTSKDAKLKDEQKVEVTANDDKKGIKGANSDLAPLNTDPDLAPLSEGDTQMPASVDTVDIDEEKPTNANKKVKATKTLNGDSTKIALEEEDLGVAPVVNASTKKITKKESDIEDDVEVDKVVVKEKPIKTHKKEEKRVEQRSKPKKRLIGGRGNVYIQVGSFVKGPEQSFINKIRRAGFKFRIKSQNGYRRVYVGPFESRKEAQKYLGLVRSKINPEAFIVSR